MTRRARLTRLTICPIARACGRNPEMAIGLRNLEHDGMLVVFLTSAAGNLDRYMQRRTPIRYPEKKRPIGLEPAT